MSTHFERSDMGETSREEALALLTEKIGKKLGADRELKVFEDSANWIGTDGLPEAQRETVEEVGWLISHQTGKRFEYADLSSAFVQAMINLGKYSENGRGHSRFSPKE